MKSKSRAALLLMLVLVMACAGALADYTVTFNANETIVSGSITVTGMPAQIKVPEGGATVVQPQNPSAVCY